MLVTTELVRDVLCNELLTIYKVLTVLPECEENHDSAVKSTENMARILMSDDFQQVTDPDEVWLLELKEFCKQKRKEQ